MKQDPVPTQPWRCPDPACKYVGTPSIHLLNWPLGHDWSRAQVVHTLKPHLEEQYPQNWEGSEGV